MTTRIQQLITDPNDFLGRFQVQVSPTFPIIILYRDCANANELIMNCSSTTVPTVSTTSLPPLALSLQSPLPHPPRALCRLSSTGSSRSTQIHRPHGYDYKLPTRARFRTSGSFEHLRRFRKEYISGRLGSLYDINIRRDGLAHRRSDREVRRYRFENANHLQRLEAHRQTVFRPYKTRQGADKAIRQLHEECHQW